MTSFVMASTHWIMIIIDYARVMLSPYKWILLKKNGFISKPTKGHTWCLHFLIKIITNGLYEQTDRGLLYIKILSFFGRSHNKKYYSISIHKFIFSDWLLAVTCSWDKTKHLPLVHHIPSHWISLAFPRKSY